MNRQQWHCFVCVADKLNFTKAAEELYLSTPTVTHHIKKLEEELNTELLVRTSKMVRLTEAGTVFYEDAKDILIKMDVAEKKLKKVAERDVAFFKIGCSSQGEFEYLEEVLQVMQPRYPRVYPQVFIEDYFKLRNLFNNRQLDVALVTKDMTKDMADCVFRKARALRSYAVVSEKSPLRGKEKVSFSDLEKEITILMHPKLVPAQLGNKMSAKLLPNSAEHFNILCENDQTGVLLARCGYGVAVMPELCLPMKLDGLNVIPVDDPSVNIEYGLAYHRNVKNDYLREFVKYFIEYLQKGVISA